ncbi:class I SAM-dependent DNA methyltransferase [Stakelama tenebrarum]|uniref:Class I SAM-dependent methyltransferase n=1 Tax=Stakelama tenebrarum TaxID=2711215 RepID=A0A6G6Y8G6_9SPHN|nr:class I SAM-dependent methyltransferase [Sphingosinithalassobacter tenebrarum]QIG81210.1 class I SAM-dependent methyltransferase [Sphingosinithalassobacter tenebrarum]
MPFGRRKKQDSVEDHFERNALRLDKARRGRFDERGWLDRFLLALPGQAHILDLGCGGGEPIDRYLIDSGHRLTGIDLSERMISLARTRFPAHRWLKADMRAATMDRAFDGVVLWDSLYHLEAEEQAALLTRVAGWLEPKGTLLFTTAPPHDEDRVAGVHHKGLDPTSVRALFAELKLTEIAHAPEDMATGGRAIWLARNLQ